MRGSKIGRGGRNSGVRRPAQGQALRRCSFNLIRNFAPDFFAVDISLTAELLGARFGFFAGIDPIVRLAEPRIDRNGILTRWEPHIELRCLSFPKTQVLEGSCVGTSGQIEAQCPTATSVLAAGFMELKQ
jgi:hypothetical protein